MVSDLSPSQPFSLHNFSPHSLSWVPSAISVYYFLEGRQPSKGKYFRTYSSLFPSFASIWYQNLFSKHPSCSWKIFRIIWLSPSTLERFFFSLCHSGIGKDLMLCLLNSSWLLWWLRKRIRGHIANRTEDFVVVLSLARILVLCAIMLCVYTVMWLQNNTLAVTKVHGQENLDLLKTHELTGTWCKISRARPGDEGFRILLVNSLWRLMLLISYGRHCYK